MSASPIGEHKGDFTTPETGVTPGTERKRVTQQASTDPKSASTLSSADKTEGCCCAPFCALLWSGATCLVSTIFGCFKNIFTLIFGGSKAEAAEIPTPASNPVEAEESDAEEVEPPAAVLARLALAEAFWQRYSELSEENKLETFRVLSHTYWKEVGEIYKSNLSSEKSDRQRWNEASVTYLEQHPAHALQALYHVLGYPEQFEIDQTAHQQLLSTLD